MSCNKSRVRDKKGTFPLPGQRSDRGKSSETLKVKNQERENLRKRMKYEKQIIREHRHILVRGQIGENQLKKKKTLKIWKGKQFVPKKRKKKKYDIENWSFPNRGQGLDRGNHQKDWNHSIFQISAATVQIKSQFLSEFLCRWNFSLSYMLSPEWWLLRQSNPVAWNKKTTPQNLCLTS